MLPWYGLGLMVRLNPSFIGGRYLELLCNNFHPFMDFMYRNKDGLFQQDNTIGPKLSNIGLKEHGQHFQWIGDEMSVFMVL